MQGLAGTTESESGRVRKRHVLYLSGFDPQGPRSYHQIYAREGRAQAALSGYTLQVGARKPVGQHASAWPVHWQEPEGPTVETSYEFLRWDDLVRQHWPTSRWMLWRVAAYASAVYWGHGLMWRSLKMSWPSFVVMTAPSFLMLAMLVLGGLLSWSVASLASAHWWLTSALWGACGFLLLREVALRLEEKTQMAWLMRSLRLIVRQSRGEAPELEARLDAFAARALELAQRDDLDELLIVGHSSGCVLATIVVARALARDAAFASRPARPALLTLGQCVPLLSHLPGADVYRQELSSLRRRGPLPWIDFTAPPDACCVALVDPTTVHLTAAQLRAEQAKGGEGPKRLSPRFSELFSDQRYRALKRDKYRCHFQYLMSTELRGDYDFFAITAGPMTLAARFAQHASIEDFHALQTFGGPNT